MYDSFVTKNHKKFCLMVKVIIIGSRNVAQHLIVISKSQTAEAEIKLVQVFLEKESLDASQLDKILFRF
jgi:hypothetical protein